MAWNRNQSGSQQARNSSKLALGVRSEMQVEKMQTNLSGEKIIIRSNPRMQWGGSHKKSWGPRGAGKRVIKYTQKNGTGCTHRKRTNECVCSTKVKENHHELRKA